MLQTTMIPSILDAEPVGAGLKLGVDESAGLPPFPSCRSRSKPNWDFCCGSLMSSHGSPWFGVRRAWASAGDTNIGGSRAAHEPTKSILDRGGVVLGIDEGELRHARAVLVGSDAEDEER
ncbi:MAG: hypothetical protein HOP12_01010 [Candidatus Eisenbacteria bacterium]|uniref:Uncharacterized protein n=1 Tax=Eiseniibacteriota bacterium TaxID=2212470 RepID=A0A849SIK9_UNCEI|nr:hypothetical protein [Candidatus Eisenbacteria bacterium]